MTSTGDPVGVASIAASDSSGNRIGYGAFTTEIGPLSPLAVGIYTSTVTDMAGNTCSSTFSVVSATVNPISLCLNGSCNPGDMSDVSTTTLQASNILIDVGSNATCSSHADCSALCLTMNVSCAVCPPDVEPPFYCENGCYFTPDTGTGVDSFCTYSSVQTESFNITSLSEAPVGGFGVEMDVQIGTADPVGSVVDSYDGTGGFAVLTATIALTQFGPTPPPISSADGSLQAVPLFSCVGISSQTASELLLQASQQNDLQNLNYPYDIHGSDFLFTSSTTISYSTTAPSGIVVDTTTLALYRFDGVSWSSAAVADQAVSISSLGVITSSGMFRQSGIYGAFFSGHDSSAPITTFSIQGSSFSFESTSFLSTFTYAVLTATDPAVNGFATGVATTTYCFDPSPASVFSVYTSSVPLPLGTHVLEYQSVDYAGNVETMKYATFTVTAGTVFNETSDNTAAQTLLVGFLGSGAQAEVVARAQDSTTLQVSSANHKPLLNVANIGNVGVHVQNPYAQLDVGVSTVALQLKSGNLTSTGTSVQAAFGFNGDVSMRHTIQTFHSTAAVGNEMDFFVWTPDAGSTATLATTEMLALQVSTLASKGSVHILPTGPPDAELVVSNGLTTGGGTMQRLQVLTPSSQRFKSDITYLKEKDEDRALAETSALKHVRFRYRSRTKDGSLYDDPNQPVRVGLIYEDAPDSIRGPAPLLLTNERLANVELALKSAMRKLDALEKRYAALKARKPR